MLYHNVTKGFVQIRTTKILYTFMVKIMFKKETEINFLEKNLF